MRDLTVRERAQLGPVVAWSAPGQPSAKLTWRKGKTETIRIWAPDATNDDALRVGLMGRAYRDMPGLQVAERGDWPETGVVFTVVVSG